MNDLISRQAAIDEVNRLAKFFWEKWHEYAPSTIAVTDALKEIPSAQQWIPWVENDDRLKDHYYYLVNHVGHEIPMLAKFHDDGCYFEIISMYPHKSIYVWDNDIITAWMPLPEIYKGDEDGKY